MRVLASTFKQGDVEKILEAMRSLPYDRLVLIGMPGFEECEDLKRIERLEEMARRKVEVSFTEESDFKDIVAQVAETLARYLRSSRDSEGGSVVLNISGGSKLLGDAALLAAFELGVEAYHIDGRVTRLPVIRGATIRDRFTKNQARMIEAIGKDTLTLEDVVSRMQPMSRQTVDRVIRELKRDRLIDSRGDGGKVMLWLTPPGREVLRALRLTRAG
ncbi:MAG: hypothetical protein JW880_00200 [Candidatus Thermoplasmatota archaeon]|nr:hypothetical protein [Candidatus Thermoplasmatota archaeon]